MLTLGPAAHQTHISLLQIKIFFPIIRHVEILAPIGYNHGYSQASLTPAARAE
jgi:hypothetical protein